MNVPLNGFRVMVVVGVAVNAAFWGPALVAPQMINDAFGFDPDYYTVWLRNVGMVLLLVSITNAAAAMETQRAMPLLPPYPRRDHPSHEA